MSETFRWEAIDRTTGTVYREDENALGSFARLDPYKLSALSIIRRMDAADVQGEFDVTLEVPEGSKAVFARRRGVSAATGWHGVALWTIIGYERPDGTGRYHFFSDTDDVMFTSPNFQAV